MRATTLTAWMWFGIATSISLSQEKQDRYTMYRRSGAGETSPPEVFAFPANQSSIVSASTQPVDAPPQNLTVDASTNTNGAQSLRYFIDSTCDATRKEKIIGAWAEAEQLAKAQTTFNLGYNYDIPHTQWLGRDWNSESSWIPERYDYRKLIGDNFRRLTQMFNNNTQAEEYIYWSCNDRSNQCTEGVQAYSWDSPGTSWSNHYTVFCDPFYDRQTMRNQLVIHAGNVSQQKVMENFHLSRGQIMFHEMWHYTNLVSSPLTGDYAYQAQNVWDLAKNNGTSWTYVNANSYALDAVAIYVQQYYNSSMPPVPFRELSKLDPTAAAAVTPPKDGNATGIIFGDQGPPGWMAPNSSSPDLSTWTEVHVGASPQNRTHIPTITRNACKGISGNYWVMSRDVAVENVKDFCNQTDRAKLYNQGTVNELELSVLDLTDSEKSPTDAPDCVGRFQNAVIDGCDGNDPINNPHNYKFGSTLTTTDGWQYQMIPHSYQENKVSCDVSVQSTFDSIDIRGKNWPDAQLGANGEGLHDQLSSCGALAKWNFTPTPDDCCFQWHATGQLPHVSKDCVGTAVLKAGGSSEDKCRSPGKRSVSGASIDDWPGYGDDVKQVFETNP